MITANELYELSILPKPHVVLGQKLLPFSFGHALILSNLGIHEVASKRHLMIAVLVCCHTYAEFNKKVMSRWSNLKWALWGWRCGNILSDDKSATAQLNLIKEYFKDGRARPDFMPSKTCRESNSKIPFIQQLKVLLRSKLNYTLQELVDTPFSTAIWDYMAYQEMEGVGYVGDGIPGERADEQLSTIESMRDTIIANHRKLTSRN